MRRSRVRIETGFAGDVSAHRRLSSASILERPRRASANVAVVDPAPRTTDVLVVVAQPDRSRAWAWLRLTLAGLWLVAMIAGYVTHERPATLQDLYASVAAGEVVSVHLVGGLPPHADSGEATLEMHWRTRSVPQVATIKVVRARDGGQVVGTPSDAFTSDDVAHEVAARDPAVRIVQTDFRSGVHFDFFGWSVPTWVASLMLGVGVVSFYVLIAGPEPWRATRWAWFWLAGFPFTLIVCLLLSGPTPALPAPRNPTRRLTGGWAFLLSLVLPHTLGT